MIISNIKFYIIDMMYDNLINFYTKDIYLILTEKKKVKGTTVKSDPKTGISVSDEEDYIYDKLKEMYGAKNIKRQWKDKEKYPWFADFYIEKENLIIEYESHWTHGRKEWDPKNPKHQDELKWLKSKNNEFYDRTIDTWTRLDPEKKATAEKNGFKFLRFYNIDEFDKWFNNPTLSYEDYKEPIALQYSDIKTNKYYHDKEEKDRWNDGRAKNSPNEDKVKKHTKEKDKKESLNLFNMIESYFDDINNMSEENQIIEVTDQPSNLYYIDNPSEKVQLAAVKVFGGALKWIMKLKKDGRLKKDPSNLVIKTAIENYPFAIVNLPTSLQTQELQLLAISNKPNSILYIWNPTEETWKKLKELYPQYFDILYNNWLENYYDRQAKRRLKFNKNN